MKGIWEDGIIEEVSINTKKDEHLLVPQANNMNRIYSIFLGLENGLTKEEVGKLYQIKDRQGDYYLNSLVFIGLANKVKKIFFLSEEGYMLYNLGSKERKELFIKKLLSIPIISIAYDLYVNSSNNIEKNIIDILSNIISIRYNIENLTTARRRASTIFSWVKWIILQDIESVDKY